MPAEGGGARECRNTALILTTSKNLQLSTLYAEHVRLTNELGESSSIATKERIQFIWGIEREALKYYNSLLIIWRI